MYQLLSTCRVLSSSKRHFLHWTLSGEIKNPGGFWHCRRRSEVLRRAAWHAPEEKNISTERQIYSGKSRTHGQVTAKSRSFTRLPKRWKDVQDVSVPRYVQSSCVRKRTNVEAQIKFLEQYHVLVPTLRPSFIPRLPSTRSSPGGPVHMTPRRPTRSSKKKRGERRLKRALMLYLDIAQGTRPSGRTAILLKFSSQRKNSSRPLVELNPSVTHLTLPNSLCI
jgi:hypothetical protein